VSKLTPRQEAEYALGHDLDRSGLSPAAQAEYDQLKQERQEDQSSSVVGPASQQRAREIFLAKGVSPRRAQVVLDGGDVIFDIGQAFRRPLRVAPSELLGWSRPADWRRSEPDAVAWERLPRIGRIAINRYVPVNLVFLFRRPQVPLARRTARLNFGFSRDDARYGIDGLMVAAKDIGAATAALDQASIPHLADPVAVLRTVLPVVTDPALAVQLRSQRHTALLGRLRRLRWLLFAAALAPAARAILDSHQSWRWMVDRFALVAGLTAVAGYLIGLRRSARLAVRSATGPLPMGASRQVITWQGPAEWAVVMAVLVLAYLEVRGHAQIRWLAVVTFWASWAWVLGGWWSVVSMIGVVRPGRAPSQGE
jgi:hypothetical protein